MPNLEWEVAHTIVSPLGSLDLNVADEDTGRIYRIQPDGYKIVPSLRVTQDNISQADGSVLHPRWKTGLVATIKVSFQIASGADNGADYTPACQADLREMDDLLALHLNAMRQLSVDANSDQRLLWTPTGYGDQRMLVDVQVLSWPDPSFDAQDNECSETFSLETPYPYAIDATEVDTDIDEGDSATINNPGTATQSPVIRLHGPSTGFTLQNADDLDPQGNPKEVVYDATRLGGTNIPSGHYVEIDFFQGSATLSGGSGLDVIASLDPELTDFFGMLPGDNDISVIGASATVLSNPAWA